MNKKTQIKKGISLADAVKLNQWSIISIDELPDDFPVLGVTEFHNKSFAEFHLVEKVIVPSSIIKPKKPKP